jgi:phosphoglycolate phosphatase-like HAD superfamily hydrolase
MLRSCSPDTGCSADRAAAAHDTTVRRKRLGAAQRPALDGRPPTRDAHRLPCTSDSTTRTRVLALDFDGVICDSLEEGLLISWNAHTRAPLQAFVEPGLAGVPAGVTDRFTGCRPFTRHLGHWLVPFTISSVPDSHAEFAARYDELSGQTIETFTTAATRYRAAVRRTYPERWLSHHVVQPGLADVLTSAYIVTARDSESVSRILDANDMGVDGPRIFGSSTDKRDALKAIAISEGVRPAEVTLVDDSIENCLAAQARGYGAWWATWGYSTPADRGLAVAHGVPAISIGALRRPPSSRLA